MIKKSESVPLGALTSERRQVHTVGGVRQKVFVHKQCLAVLGVTITPCCHHILHVFSISLYLGKTTRTQRRSVGIRPFSSSLEFLNITGKYFAGCGHCCACNQQCFTGCFFTFLFSIMAAD